MSREERMRHVIDEALQPARLDIIDESHLHAGHVGARPEGETHYRLHIVCVQFEGKSRVERHRLVYDLLQPELDNGLHAVALQLYTPQEEVS